MSASDDASYFSRFLLKFVEIIAAGLATAVSGYLIAHLTGVLSSPAPQPATAVIQVAPSALSTAPVEAVAPGTNAASNSPPQANAPSSANVIESPPSGPQEANAPPPSKPARRTANSAKAEPSRKDVDNTAGSSTRAQKPFVSRVRAALTSVDAKPKDPVAPPQDNIAGPSMAIGQPFPPTDKPRPSATSGPPPAGAELRSPPEPAPPIAPNLPTPVEINSRPISDVQTPAATPAEKETGVLSRLEQMLRSDPPLTNDDAPRPPMPVGQ